MSSIAVSAPIVEHVQGLVLMMRSESQTFMDNAYQS